MEALKSLRDRLVPRLQVMPGAGMIVVLIVGVSALFGVTGIREIVTMTDGVTEYIIDGSPDVVHNTMFVGVICSMFGILWLLPTVMGTLSDRLTSLGRRDNVSNRPMKQVMLISCVVAVAMLAGFVLDKALLMAVALLIIVVMSLVLQYMTPFGKMLSRRMLRSEVRSKKRVLAYRESQLHDAEQRLAEAEGALLKAEAKEVVSG